MLGIIIPALISGSSIPILKRLLGASVYGQYALYFSGLIITNTLVSGWLSQGVLRFYARAADKELFARQIFATSCIAGAVIFFPAAVVVWQQSHNVIMGLVFGIALWLAVVQLPLQTIGQASFLSKAGIVAETIRTVSWFGLSVLFIKATLPALPSLLGSLALSYLLSNFYLYKKNKIHLARLVSFKGMNQVLGKLIRYGWPFSFWFICYYLIGYVDKVIMRQHYGGTVQGNYNALFDLLTKGFGLTLAPVVLAVGPVLTAAYESKDRQSVKALLKKLILLEMAVFLLAVIVYLLFGYKLILNLLHIPVEKQFVQAGLLILCGTFVWQIAILLHKPMELKMQSVMLLAIIAIAFVSQLIFYYLFRSADYLLICPAGFCLAAVVYVLLVGFFIGKPKMPGTITR